MADNKQYVFMDQVFLRAPFYSFADYDLGALSMVLSEQHFRDALWLASPGFFQVLEQKSFDPGRLDESERLTLYRYYNRMCFRATPFGTFASFSMLPWSARGKAELAGDDQLVRYLEPSREWKLQVRAKKPISAGETMARNPIWYPVGDRFRFVHADILPSGKYRFRLVEIEADALLRQLMDALYAGPRKVRVLAKLIREKAGCSQEEAALYLSALLDKGVLLSDRDTGLVAVLDRRWDSAKDLLPVRRLLNGIRAQTGAAIVGTGLIREKLLRLPADLRRSDGRYFYAALGRPLLNGGIHTNQQQDVLVVVDLLRRLVRPTVSAAMDNFLKAFRDRFDQAKVPLLTALDPDTGIGYGMLHGGAVRPELLQDIAFPEARDNRPKERVWTAAYTFFFRLWLGREDRKPFEPIVIGETDLSALLRESEQGDPLPPTFALMFRSVGRKWLIESAGGVSGTTLIGRFSWFDEATYLLCREIATAEAVMHPDVLFAEIHQLSDTHVDNINCRRPIYDYVLPVNVPGGGTGQQVIPLDDLFLSVRGDELMLESRRLGKRVMPRLPTAYNFSRNELAVFRFLCDLQYQGTQVNLSLDLEKFFPDLSFYPRVEFRDLIIQPAKWKISGSDVEKLVGYPFSLGRLHLFRQSMGIPATICYGTGDRQLVFNLANDEEALFFLKSISRHRGQETLTLMEYLVPDDAVCTNGKPLAVQGIAILKNTIPVYAKTDNEVPGVVTAPRRFLMGSEWLYLKIYCSPQTADTVLTDVIAPFIRSREAELSCWFFVRYQDPDPHLRIRLRTEERQVGRLLTALKERLGSSGLALALRAYQADSYEREIERYSAELIEDVEMLFSSGSAWVIACLQQPQERRHLIVLRLVHHMVGVFWPDPGSMRVFLESMSLRFLEELGADKAFRIALDKRYRLLKTDIRAVIKEAYHFSNGQDLLDTAESGFLQRLGGLAMITRGWPEQRRVRLLADLAHMQMNRFFTSQQRQQEAVTYYFLHKYQVSVCARHQ